jgi:DNA-binding response OmpR family regulator
LHTNTVLVVGSEPDVRPLVRLLQTAGFGAWSDRPGRVAADAASFAWADALVVVDDSDHLENLRPVREFGGPKVLVTAAVLAAAERGALLDGGFDMVLAAPCNGEELTARLRRLLTRQVGAAQRGTVTAGGWRPV